MTAGTATRVAMNGDAAPGTGGRLRIGVGTQTFVNAQGSAFFAAQVIGGSQVVGDGTAIFAWDGTALFKLAAAGDVEPSTGANFASVGIDNTVISPLDALLSYLVFSGKVATTPTAKSGLFMTGMDYPVYKVVLSGDPAPGGGTFAASPAMTFSGIANGQVLFSASTVSPSSSGLFMGAVGASAQKVVAAGDQAPNGGTFAPPARGGKPQ
jgi:hypothetical protein